jgi:hypothetical protein
MRHVRVLTTLAGVVLALSACGSGDGDGDSGSSDKNADPFKGLTAEQILDKATKAAGDAKSVHMKGEIKEDDSSFKIDMAIEEGKGADGTIAAEGQEIKLLQVGKTLYMKGGPFAELSPDLKDKWIKAEGNDADEFNDITSMDKVFADMLKPEGKIEIVAGKEIGGKQTVGLKDAAGSDGKTDDKGILYISKEGPAYPLLIESTGAGGGLQFIEWNESFDVKAPPKGETVTQKEAQEAAGKG